MSYAPAAPPDQGSVRPDEQLALDLAFWQLVCAEDDWLRAELDALVADADADPGRCGSTGRRPPAHRPGPSSRGPVPAADPARPRGLPAPSRYAPRQRSPPEDAPS